MSRRVGSIRSFGQVGVGYGPAGARQRNARSLWRDAQSLRLDSGHGLRVRCRKACEVNIPSIPSSSGRVLPQVISACLFTGGSGFLGINLIRLLLARGVRVRSLDIAPFDYP